MKKTSSIIILALLVALIATPAMAAGSIELSVTFEDAECHVGQACHVQALVYIDPDNWDANYNAPYHYTYRVEGSPRFFDMTCAGWGIEKSSASRLVCMDDDAGHLYLTFNAPGTYKVSVNVVDDIGQKGNGTVSITVLP